MSADALKARIAELEAEVLRLKGTPKRTYIVAGEAIKKGAMLVVDVETLEAFEHGHAKTVAGRLKIYGTAKRSAKKGEQVRIKHWFCDGPCEPNCHLCAQVNPPAPPPGGRQARGGEGRES